MKLITRSEFESLRLDDLNEYDADHSGDTKIVRIYRDGNLIAKKKTQKKSVRYFGVAGYEQYLPATLPLNKR
ncbi:MAG: hypothetical protein V7629_13420 [Motiliproteus sp.]